MTTADHLLGLQEIDSAIDQCGHRRTRLVERTTSPRPTRRSRSIVPRLWRPTRRRPWRRPGSKRWNMRTPHADTKKKRLDAQLKTVIAPREAEALMHEMSLLDEQRSAADDEELECMDALEAAETARATADAALTQAVADQAAAQAALRMPRRRSMPRWLSSVRSGRRSPRWRGASWSPTTKTCASRSAGLRSRGYTAPGAGRAISINRARRWK